MDCDIVFQFHEYRYQNGELVRFSVWKRESHHKTKGRTEQLIEIIERREGEKSEKQQIIGEKVQVSYNSWGHLAIRVIRPCEGGDTLIVLDKETSEKVIGFCCEHIKLRPEARLPF